MRTRRETRNAVCKDHEYEKSNAGSTRVEYVPFIPLADMTGWCEVRSAKCEVRSAKCEKGEGKETQCAKITETRGVALVQQG